MRWKADLVFRYALALLIGIFPVILYKIFAPLTLYPSYILLKLFYNPTLLSQSIKIDYYTLNFVPACVAVSAYILLAFLVLSTSSLEWKRRVKLFIFGSLLILILNLIRIIVLIILLIEYGTNYFEAVHLIFWQILASVYVAAVWIFLIKHYKIKSVPVVSDFRMLRKHLMK